MFRIKQYIKMLLQNILLPLLYEWFRRCPVRKGTVIFADAHHEQMPFSMQRMYEVLEERRRSEAKEVGNTANGTESGGKTGTKSGGRMGTEPGGKTETKSGGKMGTEPGGRITDIELFICDFSKLSFGAMVRFLFRFMKQYATAEYVFICDYFLPASSCRKRKETKLVQLWHSCGLMKRIAFDAGDDIPKNYHGDMFGNYSYLTMSAQICVPVHARALRIPEDRIQATGISRTDYYFDEKWNRDCRERFYREHPEAAGKKIAVWAPTFRGNAAMPYLEGLEAVRQAAQNLADEWFFIIKAHPHVDAHGRVSNSRIPTEELFSVTDVLITDYSSVLFDYLIYQKPAVLFAPDLEQYVQNRGFYLDYREVPFAQTRTREQLEAAVCGGMQWYEEHRNEIDAFRELYTGACDGNSTQRILELVGLQR